MPKKKKKESRLKPHLPRSVWTGAISFGLVNIPVKLYSAVKASDIRFHMLHGKDNVRVQQKLFCPVENKEIPRDEVVKGYEIGPDQHIVIEEQELESLQPESSRTIDIIQFADLKDIDPIYYEKAYYVLPDERASKAYRLLYEAMKSTGKVAIGKFVMRQKEYLAALRPLADGVIGLETMHYADEILFRDQLDWLAPQAEIADRELKTAQQLIDSLTSPFAPEEIKNEYHDAVKSLIDKKAEGQEIAVQPHVEKPRAVKDLMEALQASLADVQKAKKAKDGRPSRPDHN